MHMYASRHQNALSPLILYSIILTGLILTACQTGENQTGQNQTGQHQATSDPAGQPSKEIPDNIADLENLNRFPSDAEPIYEKIGRASCREREECEGGGVAGKRERES